MRWIAALLLMLTPAANVTAAEQRPNPQAAWRSEISRALTGVTGRPEFKVVRTNKKQVLLVTFRVDRRERCRLFRSKT